GAVAVQPHRRQRQHRGRRGPRRDGALQIPDGRIPARAAAVVYRHRLASPGAARRGDPDRLEAGRSYQLRRTAGWHHPAVLIDKYTMQRREFMTLILGGATAWPLVANAQQPAKVTIGYLSIQSSAERPQYLVAFRKGLESEGFIDGQNIEIEFRAAGDRTERLQALATDLVQKNVAVIAAAGG